MAEHLGLTLGFESADVATAPTLAELREKASEIERVLVADGASNPRVFGSVARGEAGIGSDVDLLVDVRPGTGLIELCGIEEELETLLKRPVDLVTSGHGRMLHIHREAVPLR